MKLEDYNRATGIIRKIRSLDDEISDLKDIIANNTSKWRFEVRASTSFTPKSIDHCGMLPEFLNKILSAKMEQREALIEELDEV